MSPGLSAGRMRQIRIMAEAVSEVRARELASVRACAQSSPHPLLPLSSPLPPVSPAQVEMGTSGAAGVSDKRTRTSYMDKQKAKARREHPARSLAR
jgi:hypothetical protein